MGHINIPAPSFIGAAYDSENPTKNTEELSKYLLGLFSQMAEAEMSISDDAFPDPDPQEEFAFKQLWDTQTQSITAQIDRFQQIQGVLGTKMQALPTEDAISSLLNSAIEGGAELLIGWALEKVAVSVLGGMTGGITVPLVMAGIELLKGTYSDGQGLMGTLINTATTLIGGTLAANKENLTLRQTFLENNETMLNSFLSNMVSVEQHVGGVGADGQAELLNILRKALLFAPPTAGADTSTGEGGTSGEPEEIAILEDMNKNLLALAMSENIVQCPHTGTCIYTKSLSRGPSK